MDNRLPRIHCIISGGVYVQEMTILTRFPVSYRLAQLVSSLDISRGTGLLMTSRGQPALGQTLDAGLRATNIKAKTFSCLSLTEFISSNGFVSSKFNKSSTKYGVGDGLGPDEAECLFLTDALYPKDIWELDNTFGRLVRTLFYGGPEILKAKPSYDELVPNIAHIVWLGGGAMDFLFYLCVLSLVHVAKVRFYKLSECHVEIIHTCIYSVRQKKNS